MIDKLSFKAAEELLKLADELDSMGRTKLADEVELIAKAMLGEWLVINKTPEYHEWKYGDSSITLKLAPGVQPSPEQTQMAAQRYKTNMENFRQVKEEKMTPESSNFMKNLQEGAADIAEVGSHVWKANKDFKW